MLGYVMLAVLSFVAAVLFIGFQILRAWTQRRRWIWVNIALMLMVLIGTLGLAADAERGNTQASGESPDAIAAVTYVTGMAGVVFWFMGSAGGELIYLLTEHLDTRRANLSQDS